VNDVIIFHEFKKQTSSSNYTDRDVRINIKRIQHTPGNHIFINKINSLLSLIDIARLDVDCRQMPASIFIRILILFPNLEMIRIQSLPPVRELTSNDNKEMSNLFVKKTKLSLRHTSTKGHQFISSYTLICNTNKT